MKDRLVMQEQAEAIYQLVLCGYGDADQKAIRAGEISGTIQRLILGIRAGRSPRRNGPALAAFLRPWRLRVSISRDHGLF